MFSGLIGYRGRVTALEMQPGGGATLHVRCDGATSENVAAKDSIAVSGVCLTATDVHEEVVRFDVVPETLSRSTLGALRPGDLVNIEYAIRAGDRLGGHIVYGHVDAAVRVLSRVNEGQGERVRFEAPEALQPMIAEKGFIALDGVSVTIATVGAGWFEIALVPETLQQTTLGARAPGSFVNIEVDWAARYVYHATRVTNGGGNR